ncbi:MAG: HlyD family efflux transporter periplasmic adaptor subunit [Campylobacterota bacterium]|nr:HlyD family efflux transporter periplasmic adaptor subunit [Campylobacterota bacterium]
MKQSKYLLYIVLIIAIAVFIWMSLYYKSEAHRFFGLAANKEHPINFPYAVKIQSLNVYTGKSITEGEVLATFIRSDIIREKELLSQQVDELKAEKNLKVNEILSQIKQVKLEEIIQVDDINYKIEELQQRDALNKNLMKGILTQKSNTSQSLISVKIAQLQRQLQNIKHLSSNQVDNLRSQRSKQALLYREKIKQLTTKLQTLTKDETDLKLIAPFDGIVNNVIHSVNEDIKAFETLMTLNGREPTFVRGYIHVDALNTLHIGDKVSIVAISVSHNNEEPIAGVVKNFSSDITPYPERLKRYQNVALWGREVIIEIPKNNLILGEKVVIVNHNNSNNLDKLTDDTLSIFQKNTQFK